MMTKNNGLFEVKAELGTAICGQIITILGYARPYKDILIDVKAGDRFDIMDGIVTVGMTDRTYARFLDRVESSCDDELRAIFV